MKKLKKLAMTYSVITYIYAACALALTAAPLITLWLMLYAVGCR